MVLLGASALLGWNGATSAVAYWTGEVGCVTQASGDKSALGAVLLHQHGSGETTLWVAAKPVARQHRANHWHDSIGASSGTTAVLLWLIVVRL